MQCFDFCHAERFDANNRVVVPFWIIKKSAITIPNPITLVANLGLGGQTPALYKLEPGGPAVQETTAACAERPQENETKNKKTDKSW